MSAPIEVILVSAPGLPERDAPGPLGPYPSLGRKLDEYYQGPPVGTHQQQTVGAAAARFAIRDDAASSVVVQVQTAALRYTFDGTAPTAAIGFRADPGAILVITGRATLSAVQWIREGAVDGAIAYQCFS